MRSLHICAHGLGWGGQRPLSTRSDVSRLFADNQRNSCRRIIDYLLSSLSKTVREAGRER